MQSTSIRYRTSRSAACHVVARYSAALALAACAPKAVSLGGGEPRPEDFGPCEMGVDGVVRGDVEVSTQDQIDELAGCEEITGSLGITASQPIDLSPLGALRVVRGGLRLLGAGHPDNLTDLTGLDQLERVGYLGFLELGIATLAPLSNLTQVAQDPLADPASIIPLGGYVEIGLCPNLMDLTGLEQLAAWDEVNLWELEGLQSLNGLTVVGLDQSLLVYLAPNLRSIAGILGASYGVMNVLSLIRTGLESFEIDGDLNVREVELLANSGLTSLDDLGSIGRMETLTIHYNHRLERLPELSGSTLNHVTISANPLLRSIPALGSPPDGGTALDPARTEIVYTDFEWFEVSDNALLTDMALPRAFSFGSHVRILNNPNLTSVDLNPLESVDHLVIRDNPALAAVQMPLLAGVDDLQIVNNPSLPTSGFANLKTFSNEMSGNLDAPAPDTN